MEDRETNEVGIAETEDKEEKERTREEGRV